MSSAIRYLSLGLAVSVCALFANAGYAQAESPERVPSLREGGQPFVLEEENSWVVLHFMSPPGDEKTLGQILEMLEEGPEMAGVRQVVIVGGEREEAQRLANEAAPGFVHLYYDADQILITRYKITKFPSTLLLGPGRKEVYRHESRDSEDFLPQRSLAAQIQRRWRNPKIEVFKKDGKALAGYDPVAYFTERQAVRGKPNLRSNYRGDLFYFSTAENRRKFADDPESYLPAFGGWDATSMAEGGNVEPDPHNFILRGGELFLFYKGVWGDSRETWEDNEEELLRKANEAWDMKTGKGPRGNE